MTTRTLATPDMRWMIRRDLTAVIGIDAAQFADPLSEQDFIDLLRVSSNIGMVIEYGGDVVGYVLYELHATRLNILRLAICPLFMRMSMGTLVIERLKAKLTNSHRRKWLECLVPDDNLPAHLFLRANGFVAVSTVRKEGQDYYHFRYRVDLTECIDAGIVCAQVRCFRAVLVKANRVNREAFCQ